MIRAVIGHSRPPAGRYWGGLLFARLNSSYKFQLPLNHKPNTRVVDDLPLKDCFKIWYNSLSSTRLATLQDELVELMIPADAPENQSFKRTIQQTPIDDDGNYINELILEVVNDKNSEVFKLIAFVHGYGASMGCFARNFQIVNKFNNLKQNYRIHFIDNISFGLSSNPKIPDDENIDYNQILRVPKLKLNDSTVVDPKKLYNKYYKLIDSYELDEVEFNEYRVKAKEVINRLETYYVGALENWRIAHGIDLLDYLIGHSFGGYWSATYALKYKDNLKNLVLLSPVGVERHVHAINNPLDNGEKAGNTLKFTPTLDPTSYNFLSRWPILSEKQIKSWYTYLPFLPRYLKWLGPFGVLKYYKMWYLKLFKINKLIHKRGGARLLFKSSNDVNYGTNKECLLIIEYLYNSITLGTHSDIYSKYLLTPSIVSRLPLYDRFINDSAPVSQNIHFVYGQYDFMNAEAGSKLCKKLNEMKENDNNHAKFYKISEAGHNLYIDNPFETNQLIFDIVKAGEE